MLSWPPCPACPAAWLIRHNASRVLVRDPAALTCKTRCFEPLQWDVVMG